MRLFLLITLTFLVLGNVYSQESSNDDYVSVLETGVPLTINLEEEEAEVEAAPLRQKKRKKNVFYGQKTKKAFTRSGYGDNIIFELFNYLPDYQEPDPYVRDIFWYDFKSRTIKKTRNIDKEYGVILHGPYKKLMGDQVLEEGIFYMGTKHGRWTKHTKKDILIDKEKYYKGWPKESIARYYDAERTRLKEIIPVEYGVKEGNYYYFHENGQVAVFGEFQNDEKVGIWREFYESRRRRKREIVFPDNPYETDFIPFISKEWDRRGRVVYDRQKTLKDISGG